MGGPATGRTARAATAGRRAVTPVLPVGAGCGMIGDGGLRAAAASPMLMTPPPMSPTPKWPTMNSAHHHASGLRDARGSAR